jgi:hypothetical protein
MKHLLKADFSFEWTVYRGQFLLLVLVAPRLCLASPAEVDRPLSTPRRGLSPQ